MHITKEHISIIQTKQRDLENYSLLEVVGRGDAAREGPVGCGGFL
jgi:hypothetical protein